MRQGAQFSEDRKYRYALWRICNEDKPLVMFIGLNPSTANERTDDPTIRRVTRFANDWGYGGFYMMNLFGIVTPYPADLKTCGDPIGENDHWLEKIAIDCGMICFVWGAFPEAMDRAKEVAGRFPGAYCMGRTKAGHPKHPLYLAAETRPISFK